MCIGIVVGDPHFKIGNTRDTDRMAAAVLALAEAKRPDFVVVLGDVLDRHETINIMPLQRAVLFLRSLSAIAPVFVLVGNHDLALSSEILSPVYSLVGLDAGPGGRLRVAAQVLTEHIGGKKFVFVPYVPPGRFAEALATAPGWEDATCIFAHQEFRGAKMGAIVSEVGDPWPLDAPLVVSGHIHDFDALQPNLIYTGAPFQHAFGDREDKTVSLFDFAANSHVRVDLGLPRKLSLSVRAADLAAFDLPAVIARHGPTPLAEREVRLTIEGSAAEIRAAGKLLKVQAWRSQGVKLVFRDTTPPAGSALARELREAVAAESGDRAAPGAADLRSVPFTTLLRHAAAASGNPRHLEILSALALDQR